MKKLIVAFSLLCPLFSFAQASEFDWLHGTWKIKNKETYEVWKTGTDQKMLEGISYRIKGADTVVTENLKIIYRKDAFYYVPDVAGDQPEVYFRIIKYSTTGFTAENPQHDFPKIIRYLLMTPTSIKAEIEGDGKVIPFYFDKIK